MLIKFLEAGESPDIGPYKKGDEREMSAIIGNVFIQRGIAEEIGGIFPTVEPRPSPKTKTKIKEVDDNG